MRRSENFLPRIEVTKRQLEILELRSQGLNNKEIASKLKIAKRSVESHITRILMVLEAKSVVHAYRIALERRLLSIDSVTDQHILHR